MIRPIAISLTLLLAPITTTWAQAPPPGLVLQLDASTLRPMNGPVSRWRDLSGKGNDVQQPDPAHQPRLVPHGLHGKPVVVFEGQQFLDGPAALPAGAKSLTLVAVWKRDASGGSQSIVEQASPGMGRRAALLTANSGYGFNGESNDQHQLMAFQPGVFAASIVRLQPDGTVTLFHNGYANGGLIDIQKENVGDDRLRIGEKVTNGEERLTGAIAEIMVYDRALSSDEARQLTTSLVKKWGIQVDKLDPERAAYQAMIQKNAADPNRYTEPVRPQYHFTPIEGWMNDPNGLCFFKGMWHLFYQHDVAGRGDHKAWGLALSKDLVHWEHRVPAILPDETGDIWSGSAVVDWHDTSGFFGGKPGLVCIYALMNPVDGGRQCQAIAYSADGINFTKYDKNPVIPELRYQPGETDNPDFRDPKVFWHEPTKQWVMVVAGGTVRIYTSPNLRDWTFRSINKNIQTECPDLFEMPIEGEPGKTKWALTGAGRWYILGSFDGKVFTPETDKIPVNYGPDFYASQTFNDAPDGRRIMITWMYNFGYGGGFPGRPGGGMTIPVNLTLRHTADGLRIFQAPVHELQSLREGHFTLKDRAIPQGDLPLPQAHGTQLEIIAEFDPGTSTEFGLHVRKGGGVQTTVGYRVKDGKVFLDRRLSGKPEYPNWKQVWDAPLALENGHIRLHLFVDWSSVEVLANDGREAITCNIIDPLTADAVEAYSDGGAARLVSLDAYHLKTVWRGGK